MAVKRTKSFSPYTYNVQYRKPGSSPFQQPQTYIPSVPLNEVKYVVNKRKIKEDLYFTYVNGEFYYMIDDDCTINFINYSSTFNFINDRTNDEFEKIKINNMQNQFKYFDVKRKGESFDYHWYSNNCLKIIHNLNSKIDLCILIDDVYYFDFSFEEINQNEVQIYFDNEIFLNLKIIIYNIQTSNFKYKIDKYNNLIFNDLNNLYILKNLFNSSLLKIKAKQLNNKIKNILCENITPRIFIFKWY